MSITTVNVQSPTNEIIFQDTAMGNAIDGVRSSSATLFYVKVDNTLNVNNDSYVKLYNLASGSVTVGTTPPDEIIFVQAGIIKTVTFWTGAELGAVYDIALSACCVTAGGTAGTTSPAYSVTVSISYQ